MNLYFTRTLFLVFIVFSFPAVSPAQQLTSYVNPFTGTAEHGHTFPGATLPFGMVQLSPDTGIEGWDWCSGYHDSDSSIMGFSHLHLSGTGGGDLGDVLLMASTGEWETAPGSKEDPDAGYRSRFSHDTEEASPGYYSVLLEDDDIRAEMTTALRTGFHRYTFPASEESNIIVDLEHGIRDRTTESFIEVTAENELVGMRRSSGWAADQYVYFVARFSKPFKELTLAEDDALQEAREPSPGRRTEGKASKALLRFTTKEGEAILVKVGISAVSIEGARKNMEGEISHWNFNRVRKDAQETWETELERIEVEGGTRDQMVTFYTALYHTMIHPNISMDVDRRYRGRDGEIHTAKDFTAYTLFSLWDTFRALHPLYEIILPERNVDFIKSMLAGYEQAGKLPVWELASNETGTMIGYHSVPVIVGALLRGNDNFDKDLAYRAMKHSAMENERGLIHYKRMGYIPRELENNSVSKTLEYAYDDWCIAQAARLLEKEKDAEYFAARAMNYKNTIDSVSGFARGKDSSGAWNPDFDPVEVSILGRGDFTEGNSWQYTFFVPHDVEGLINLLGGDKAFAEKLDALFTQEAVVDNEHAVDVTGLIGQYAHGNEPSHHVAYLYNYAGQPWKTQAMVRRIMTELYGSGRAGLSGNEDCGQMSAWYILSSMGFYPVNPASGEYVIGSPLFEEMTIHTGSGEDFEIRVRNDNAEVDKYVQSVYLNRQHYPKSFIRHETIMNGGKLEFSMVGVPSYEWAVSPAYRPGKTQIRTAAPEKEKEAPVPPDARRRMPRR
ncbi:putative alpha-1,2-mannosidase [Anseongella ginsenosidimutans]|uniref:Putative alpha-1,2-mannosidase n=1 Tax=Anseongella ginsenosidimutans TaxID=496056 RepID=A0A4R3KSY5_9SPHI|nr:GH92 family glycosyl hydrolase [Anseongella ginsenosidimutans]QEC52954.1 glycoside hydrolase family 92 protein [Anseongella ginsenosidimutans]TCS87353.1 putative alpha-1,2-mannosidase [Anseongella ginsenosidimutans]